MAQGSLFGGATSARAFVVNVDGGSRGNPGPAAAGWVIRDASDGQAVVEEGLYVGTETNNRAEYMGLLFALEDLHLLKASKVLVRADSQLMVLQMQGQYKVKNAGLKGLFARCRRLSQAFESFRIEHVRREENRDADRMVNAALDEAKKAQQP